MKKVKNIVTLFVIQTAIIILAIAALYWWQLSITDALIEKNVETIQGLQRQIVNLEQKLAQLRTVQPQ